MNVGDIVRTPHGCGKLESIDKQYHRVDGRYYLLSELTPLDPVLLTGFRKDMFVSELLDNTEFIKELREELSGGILFISDEHIRGVLEVIVKYVIL